MSKEVWLDVKNTNGFYQVSNRGRVRSYMGVGRCAGVSKAFKPRYLVPQLNKHRGYVYISLELPKRKNWSLHRLVAEHFLAKPHGKEFVNHRDFDRTNNDVNNLEWCTHSENIRYSADAGRMVYDWEKNARRKLDPDTVRAIRESAKCQQMKQVAADYRLNPSTVSLIVSRRRWKNV